MRPVLFVAPSMRVLDLLLQMRVSRAPHGAGGRRVRRHRRPGRPSRTWSRRSSARSRTSTTRMRRRRGSRCPTACSRPTRGCRSRNSRRAPGCGARLTRSARRTSTRSAGWSSPAGRVPARGELVRHPAGIEFEVIDADPRRIKPPAHPAGRARGRRAGRGRLSGLPQAVARPRALAPAAGPCARLALAARAPAGARSGCRGARRARALALPPLNLWPCCCSRFTGLSGLLDGPAARGAPACSAGASASAISWSASTGSRARCWSSRTVRLAAPLPRSPAVAGSRPLSRRSPPCSWRSTAGGRPAQRSPWRSPGCSSSGCAASCSTGFPWNLIGYAFGRLGRAEPARLRCPASRA